MKLFATAFLQVFFVAGNTVFISNQNYVGTAAFGFMISWLWAGNIKKVAIGGNAERIVYAIGAMVGCLAGLYLSTLITKLLA